MDETPFFGVSGIINQLVWEYKPKLLCNWQKFDNFRINPDYEEIFMGNDPIAIPRHRAGEKL